MSLPQLYIDDDPTGATHSHSASLNNRYVWLF